MYNSSIPNFTRKLTRIAFVLALCLFSLQAVATPLEKGNGITAPTNAVFRAGIWQDPQAGDKGWDINRQGDTVYAIWYTFNAAGNAVWYQAEGSLEGSVFSAPLQISSFDFASQSVASVNTVGSVTIDFKHPQLAQLSWSLDELQGTQILTPLLFATEPVLNDYSGTWSESADAGYGISLQTQGPSKYALIYLYDSEGTPTWLAGRTDSPKKRINMEAFTGSCPGCNSAPMVATAAGALYLNFINETRLRANLDFPQTYAYWNHSRVKFVMRSDPPSGRPSPAALAHLASLDALKFYYRAAFLQNGNQFHSNRYCYDGPIVSPPPPVAPTNNSILSGTNNQVAGVEEADIVKSTSDYMYTLDSSENQLFRNTKTGNLRQTISRYSISPNGDTPAMLGKFRAVLKPVLEDSPIYLQSQGLFHFTSTATHKKQLIYTAGLSQGGCEIPSADSTYVFKYFSHAGTTYKTRSRLQIDGELIASRRIGNFLFLTISYRPDLRILAQSVMTPEELEALTFDEDTINTIFDRIDASQLLPKIKFAAGLTYPLVSVDKVLMPPLPDSRLDATLSTLLMINLDNLKSLPESLAVMGAIDGIYASPQSVYFVSSRVDNRLLLPPIPPQFKENTDIHKIAISGDKLVYRGSGTVEGNLGGEPTKMAYRMSEYEGKLRVISQNFWNDRWGDFGNYRLTILADDQADQLLLNTVSVLPNKNQPTVIGKPGEFLRSVRFFADRAYAVTFERIDPLYVFDLADASHPRISGELEIPGFSSYLHPVSHDLLIGVGMAATNTDDSPPRTYLQGVQVGLFDVSDLASPRSLGAQIFGQRGSTSIALDNPHAFTLLAADPEAGRPLRFSLPLQEHGPADGVLDPDPSTWYQWKSTGLLMFEIQQSQNSSPELHLASYARLADDETTAKKDKDFFQSYDADSSRSVIYGDEVFYYYQGGVYSSPWATDGFSPAENCDLCKPDN